MIRKYDIINGYAQGKLLKPDKVKIVYRYKENQLATSKLYLLGYVQDETSPRLLIGGYPLTDSLCPAERVMTEVIEVANELKVSAMRILISNYEQLKDVHLIDAVYDIVDIPLGLKDDEGNFTCGFALMSFAINNGAIYTYDNAVTLNHTYNGTPTHYRASMLSDFSDAEWIPHTDVPEFTIAIRGINRVYLQLKNATEESNVLYDDIGWSGIIEIYTYDSFDPDVDVKTDYTEIATISYYPQVLPLAADSFDTAVGTFADYTETTTVTVT